MRTKYRSAAHHSKSAPTVNTPNREHHRRSRNEFKSWLIWQLNQRGAGLPPNPTYLELQAATQKYLMGA